METKWKVFAILLIGLLSIGFFFFSKGANGMDRSETSTESIKKASMSQTPVAKKETKETVDPKDQREIYLAGGCFWGVEEYFSRVPTEREKRPSMNWSLKQAMLKQFTSPTMSRRYL